MSGKKRVSFVANGKKVTFFTKNAIKKRPQRRIGGRNYKIRRDTNRLAEAGLSLIHPAAPMLYAAARLAKDILET